MEFGYWGIKGLGEPSLWLIAYLKLDVKVNAEDFGAWFGGRNVTLGLDFPNLPYLIDGDFKLTESSAIPQYLANKSDKPCLNGKDIKEQATIKMLEGVLSDLLQQVSKGFRNEACETHYKATLDCDKGDAFYFLNQLSTFLGTKDFFIGHETIFDFRFAYFYDWILQIAAKLGCNLDKFANLKAHAQRVQELPGVKELVAQRQAVPFLPPGMLPFMD